MPPSARPTKKSVFCGLLVACTFLSKREKPFKSRGQRGEKAVPVHIPAVRIFGQTPFQQTIFRQMPRRGPPPWRMPFWCTISPVNIFHIFCRPVSGVCIFVKKAIFPKRNLAEGLCCLVLNSSAALITLWCCLGISLRCCFGCLYGLALSSFAVSFIIRGCEDDWVLKRLTFVLWLALSLNCAKGACGA